MSTLTTIAGTPVSSTLLNKMTNLHVANATLQSWRVTIGWEPCLRKCWTTSVTSQVHSVVPVFGLNANWWAEPWVKKLRNMVAIWSNRMSGALRRASEVKHPETSPLFGFIGPHLFSSGLGTSWRELGLISLWTFSTSSIISAWVSALLYSVSFTVLNFLKISSSPSLAPATISGKSVDILASSNVPLWTSYNKLQMHDLHDLQGSFELNVFYDKDDLHVLVEFNKLQNLKYLYKTYLTCILSMISSMTSIYKNMNNLTCFRVSEWLTGLFLERLSPLKTSNTFFFKVISYAFSIFDM
jgi:hypothetical protein